jgi:hypothetical protein
MEKGAVYLSTVATLPINHLLIDQFFDRRLPMRYRSEKNLYCLMPDAVVEGKPF